MALNFGLFGDNKTLQTADYRTAGSHQNENLKSLQQDAADTWVEIHTVTEGKTYYISGILFSTTQTGVAVFLGTGAAASEVAILAARIDAAVPLFYSMPTPIKIVSATRVSVRSTTASTCYYTLIGWEE